MRNNIKMLLIWVLVSFVFTMTFGGIYVALQQNLRQSANNMPFQIALDTAMRLNSGESATSVIPAENIDIKQSLSPIVMVYDKNYKLLATNAVLDGKAPVIPNGVLLNATQNGNRVTWQPENGVRLATVTVPYSNGYVVAGQSLRETESQISKMGNMVLMMWAFSVIAGLIVIYVGGKVVYFRD